MMNMKVWMSIMTWEMAGMKESRAQKKWMKKKMQVKRMKKKMQKKSMKKKMQTKRMKKDAEEEGKEEEQDEEQSYERNLASCPNHGRIEPKGHKCYDCEGMAMSYLCEIDLDANNEAKKMKLNLKTMPHSRG